MNIHQIDSSQQNSTNQKKNTTSISQVFDNHIIYLFTITLIDIVLVITFTYEEIYYIIKLAFDIALTISALFFRNDSKRSFIVYILPFFSQIGIMLIFIFVKDNSLNILSCLILVRIKYRIQGKAINDIFATLVLKVCLLCILSIKQQSAISSITVAMLIVMDLYQLYIHNTIDKIKNNSNSHNYQLQDSYSGQSQNGSSSSKRDNIWKKRIEKLPISIILVSKENLKITHKNNTLYYQFKERYNQEDDLEELLLEKLKFSIVETDLNQINQLFSKKKRGTLSKVNSKLRSLNFEQNLISLQQVLINLKNGIYENYLGNPHKSLELSCQYIWQDGSQSIFSAQVHLSEEDDEIIIALNDIQKQQELSQLLIKDKFKSKIIESFSHELRTPLNSSLTFLQSSLIENDISHYLKDTFIKPAFNALKLQSYLINDIIDFQSYYQNELDLNIEEFYLSQLISEISQLFYYQVNTANIGFMIEIIDCQIIFCSDYQKLMQIIINLIQNAIKFTQQGSIKLIFSQNQNTKNLLIKIIDEGIGIPEEKIKIIQDNLRMIQEEQDFSFIQNWQGFGLLISQILLIKLAPKQNHGLKISNNIEKTGVNIYFEIQYTNYESSSYSSKPVVRKLKTIQLEMLPNIVLVNDRLSQDLSSNSSSLCQMNSYSSRMNLQAKITALQVASPLLITQVKRNITIQEKQQSLQKIISYKQLEENEEQQLRTLKDMQQTTSSCQCSRILSVDDEIFNQKSMEILIKKIGYQTLLAFNGQEAIQKILGLKKCSDSCQLLSLILMDYQMPIMDGVQATITLKNLMTHKTIPLIPIYGLTAFTNVYDLQKFVEAGLDQVFHKPLKLNDLKYMLSQSRSSDQKISYPKDTKIKSEN